MAITFVQASDTGAAVDAAVNGRTVTLNSCVAGNLLIIAMRTTNLTGFTITGTGWTSVSISTGANVWYKLSAAGGTESYTITINAAATGRMVAWMGEYSGVDQTTPVESNTPWRSVSAGGCAFLPAGTIPTKYNAGFWHFYGMQLSDLSKKIHDTIAWTNGDYEYLPVTRSGGTRGWISHILSNANDAARLECGVFDALISDNAEPVNQSAYSDAFTSTTAGGGVTITANSATQCTLTLRPATGTASLGVSATGGSGVFVQSKNTTITGATTFSPTFTSNPTVGNLLFLVISIRTLLVSMTVAPTGWAAWGTSPIDLEQTPGSTAAPATRHWVFWKICTSAAGDKTASGTTFGAVATGAGLMVEFSGCNMADPTANGIAPVKVLRRFVSITTSVPVVAGGFESGSKLKTTRDMLEVAVFGGASGFAAFSAMSDNFTGINSPSNGTSLADITAYKASLGPGMINTRPTNTTPGAGSLWENTGTFIFAFQMQPDGGDHWGWAEGSDSSDSWQMMPA